MISRKQYPGQEHHGFGACRETEHEEHEHCNFEIWEETRECREIPSKIHSDRKLNTGNLEF